MLVFTYGKGLFIKMETMQKNNYAFSTVAVKFCEVLKCQTCKEHGIKERSITF
jgi:hypothetical protein